MENMIINRFIERLRLPKNFTFIAKNLVENKNEKLYNQYTNNLFENKTLELYHTVRSSPIDRDINPYDSIMHNGFYISPNINNKGRGVYMANHGRYSWLWGSCGKNRKAIICNVIADPDLVERYKSEIYSEIYDSEYLIKDTKIIYPKYFLEYEILGDESLSNIQGFVKSGKYNCKKCDKISIRCDCKQYPIFDEKDFIQL